MRMNSTLLLHETEYIFKRSVVKEGCEDGLLSSKGRCWGTRKGARIPGTLKDEWRALEVGHLSLRELFERNLAGRLLYWGPQRIC